MWKTVCGYDVFVEGGIILRATKKDSNGSDVAAAVYRKSRYSGWDREGEITVSAFRAGVARGTIRVF